MKENKPFIDNLICGMNEVHFESQEIHLIWQMTRILNISFDDQRESHIKMVKALYFQFFVKEDKTKSNF